MTNGFQFYAATVLCYFFAYACMGLGFNLQFGMTGVVNLALIVSVAAGAYVSAVLELGGGGGSVTTAQHIFGATLPFPIPTLAGALAGGVLALLIGLLFIRVISPDYFAIVTIVVADAAVSIVGNYNPLFNGQAGLFNIPTPIFNSVLTDLNQQWVLTGIAAGAAVIVWFFCRRIERAPVSRVLRATRDNPLTAASIGINVSKARLGALAAGGTMAGLGGATLVYATAAWSTASWQPIEVLVILAAVVLGGSGSVRGTLLGVLLVPFIIGQGITFLPPIGGNAQVNDNLQFIVVGILQVAILWWAPRGILPERAGIKRRSVNA